MVVFPALSRPTIMTLCSGGKTGRQLNVLVNALDHTHHCSHSSDFWLISNLYLIQSCVKPIFDCVIEQCVIPYSNSKYNGWCQSLLTIGRSRSKELNKGQTQRVKYAARLKHVLHASPAPRDNTVHFTHSTYCLILKRCEFAIKCIKHHRI